MLAIRVPLLTCVAAAALLAWRGGGEEDGAPWAGDARRADAAEAGEQVVFCGLRGVARSARPRRTVPTPGRATARPRGEASSAPSPLETETRAYEIPATHEGWGWRLHVPVDVVEAAGPGDEPRERMIAPEQVGEVLTKVLARPLRDRGLDLRRVAWVPPAGLEVTTSALGHAVVAQILGRLVWTPSWLGLSLAGDELADMLVASAPDERAWAREALRGASAALYAAVRAAEARRSPDPLASPPGAPAAGTLELACTLRAFTCHDAFMRDVGVVACGWRVGSGSLRMKEPRVRSGREFLDDAQYEVIVRAIEKSERVAELGPTRVRTFPNGEACWLEVVPGLTLGLRVDLAPRADGQSPWLVTRLSLRRRVGTDLQFVPVGTLALPDGAQLLLHPVDTLTEEPGPSATTYVLLTLETRGRAEEVGSLAPDAFTWVPAPAER